MRTLALGLLAVSLVALGCTEDLGARVRRECVSLVATVLEQDQTVSNELLYPELAARGIVQPEWPGSPPEDPHRWMSTEEWLNTPLIDNGKQVLSEAQKQKMQPYWEALKKYGAKESAFENKWKEIRQTPAYKAAWDAAFAQRREHAVKECIVTRAAALGAAVKP